MISFIRSECDRLGVKVGNPKNVEEFKKAVESIRVDRRKAENVLLDEIERDVEEKENFLAKQVRTLQDMNTDMNTLIEHKNVISIAAQVIAGALEAGAEMKGDEEKK